VCRVVLSRCALSGLWREYSPFLFSVGRVLVNHGDPNDFEHSGTAVGSW